MAYIYLFFFCHPSHNVRTLIKHFLWKQPCQTHISFLSWTWISFCSGHLGSWYGIQEEFWIVILLLMPCILASCIDYREEKFYAQLCLPWTPWNPSLLIPIPPVSLYFSAVRFTMQPHPSLGLPPCCFMSQHMLYCCTCCFVQHPCSYIF